MAAGLLRVMREWRAASADQTIAAGAEIARLIPAPSLVLLEGTLGAGKTTLMKGVVSALNGADADAVTSPTFTLVHEYSGERDGRPVRLLHLDLYRLEHERELLPLGLDEMLNDRDALVFIEWGEKFPLLASRADFIFRIASQGSARSIQLQTS